jgi:hypothetical protein
LLGTFAVAAEDDHNVEELEKKASELRRLLEEAKRIHLEITEHLARLRRGGKGEHTDGRGKQ